MGNICRSRGIFLKGCVIISVSVLRSCDRLLGIVDFPDSRPEPKLEAIHFLKSLLVHDFTLTPVPFVLRCLILE
jgi:hypothetical protein